MTNLFPHRAEPSSAQTSGRHFSLSSLRTGRAFSMVEILVTVALLSFIILGLVAMFNQTRRAFTSSLTQTDVMESGRSVADFIGREMEQIAPSGLTNGANLYVNTVINYIPVGWPLTAPGDFQTNNLQQVYFLTRYNQQWNIIGYKVFTTLNGIGSLYRFSAPFPDAANANVNASVLNNNLGFYLTTNLNYFINTTTNSPYFTKLIDGVVDFRVRAYTTNGVRLFPFGKTNSLATYTVISNVVPGDFSYLFLGNSLPAYVDVELGIIEDRALAHYNALTNGTDNAVAFGYLTNHAAQVHNFRQHITLPNVNPAAL